MTYELRLATEHDIPELRELIPFAARALSVGYYAEPQVGSMIRHAIGVDSQFIADGTYFVVADTERIAGCGGWNKRATLYGGDRSKGESDPLLDPATDAARIRAFFVHPDPVRRGIGRRLIETCEDAAREAGFSRMELGTTLPGEPLYAAMGYTATDRFDIALPDGEMLPSAHMIKSLEQDN